LRADLGLGAERLAGLREEQLADLREPLRRQVAAVVGSMAVGPLVVAGGVDERVGERLEVGQARLEVAVGAAAGTVLDVAEVDDPADVGIGVDLRDVRGELGDQRRAVRDVPDDGERLRRSCPLALPSASATAAGAAISAAIAIAAMCMRFMPRNLGRQTHRIVGKL
jgi:hypothetical protein